MRFADSRLPGAERANLARLALADLERDLKAEARASEQELKRERFGAPTLVTEVVCHDCGMLLTKNDAGLWCHLGPTTCPRPIVSVIEVAR